MGYDSIAISARIAYDQSYVVIAMSIRPITISAISTEGITLYAIGKWAIATEAMTMS